MGISSGCKDKKLVVTDEQKDPTQGSQEFLVASPDQRLQANLLPPQLLPSGAGVGHKARIPVPVLPLTQCVARSVSSLSGLSSSPPQWENWSRYSPRTPSSKIYQGRLSNIFPFKRAVTEIKPTVSLSLICSRVEDFYELNF